MFLLCNGIDSCFVLPNISCLLFLCCPKPVILLNHITCFVCNCDAKVGKSLGVYVVIDRATGGTEILCGGELKVLCGGTEIGGTEGGLCV